MFLINDLNELYFCYIKNVFSINNEKYKQFKKHLYFLNIFKSFMFKHKTHLKSYYYKNFKVKKTIYIKHKKTTKNVVVNKRKYKYFQLLFKTPISMN
jgi:hypothetical protein